MNYKATQIINGFEHRIMFSSVSFSNDGKTILVMYDNETEPVNKGDEICVVQKIYYENQWRKTNILDRNIDPNDFTIEI